MPAASATPSTARQPTSPAESAGEAGGDSGARPQPDREADGAVQADAIDQQAGERRAGGVGEGEGAADPAVLRVREVELARQHGRQRGERLRGRGS